MEKNLLTELSEQHSVPMYPVGYCYREKGAPGCEWKTLPSKGYRIVTTTKSGSPSCQGIDGSGWYGTKNGDLQVQVTAFIAGLFR